MNVTLKFGAQEISNVPRELVKSCGTMLSHVLEDAVTATDNGLPVTIPLDNISYKTMNLILNFFSRCHTSAGKFVFLEKLSTAELVAIHDAADFLQSSEELYNATSFLIAQRIRGKSTHEMRNILCITNDFSPAEEEQIYTEMKWALD